MKLRYAALIASALPWEGLIDHAVGEVERLEGVRELAPGEKREQAIDALVAWADAHLDWAGLGPRRGWAMVERYDALVLRWLLRGVVEATLRIVRRKAHRRLTAADLYAVYADRGLPMPTWAELPEAIRHWEAVADVARRGA